MKRNINKKTVCIIGHFGFAKNLLNGQTVKTKIITKELEKQLGKEEVLKIDTHGGKKKMLQLIFQLPVTMKNVKNQSAKALANVSLKLGKVSADSACCYIFHQPKVPKNLKKLKKI